VGALRGFAEQSLTIMASGTWRANPWSIPLVLAGIVFTLTASAYAVTSVRKLDAAAATAGPDGGPILIAYLDRYGAGLMYGELVLLAIVAVAAVASERRRTNRRAVLPDSQLQQYPTQRTRRVD